MSQLFRPSGLTGSVGAQAGALLVGRGLGFLRGVALAWLIVPLQFGAFQVAIAVVNLMVPLCSLGLATGVLRFIPIHEARGTLPRFAFRATLALLGVGAATCSLFLVIPDVVANVLYRVGAESSPGTPVAEDVAAGSLVQATAGCVFTLIVFHLVVEMMKGLRLFRAVGVMEVVGVILFTSLAVGAPLVGFDTAEWVLLAYGVGNVAAVFLFAPGLVRYIRSHADGRVPSLPSQPGSASPSSDSIAQDGDSALRGGGAGLVRYSLWMAISQVTWHGLQQYLLWHIAKVSGFGLAGVYYAVRLFPQLILLGAQAISRSLSANVTRLWEVSDRDEAVVRLELGTKIGAYLVLALACAMSLLKPVILSVFPSEIAVGADCFDPLALSFAWFASLEFLVIRFHLEKRSSLTFWASFVGFVVLIAGAVVVLGPPWSDSTSAGEADILVRAAWVCATGAGTAVFACVVMLAFRGSRPSWSTLLLMAITGSIGFGGLYGVIALAVITVLAFTPIGLLSERERSVLASYRWGR